MHRRFPIDRAKCVPVKGPLDDVHDAQQNVKDRPTGPQEEDHNERERFSKENVPHLPRKGILVTLVEFAKTPRQESAHDQKKDDD